MSLQEDINRIKQMEDEYFIEHGEYFETDNSKVVSIPGIGEDKKLKKFTKFKGNKDKTPHIVSIDFIPKEKDYKFTIGQFVLYDGDEVKRSYMIRAERRNGAGKIETTVEFGGDQFVIDTLTEGNSYEEVD